MTEESKMPPFTVELLDDRDAHIERVLARCGHADIADWAYDVAVKAFPGRIVTLRNGALVVRETGPK